MDAKKLGFGTHYSDNSGWEWLVELRTGKDGSREIGFDIGGGGGSFDPAAINPREIALAFDKIADALNFDVLDERIAEAVELTADSDD